MNGFGLTAQPGQPNEHLERRAAGILDVAVQSMKLQRMCYTSACRAGGDPS